MVPCTSRYANVAAAMTAAKDLAAVFQGVKSGYSYGRQVNPTITALESKISVMENGHNQCLLRHWYGGNWHHNVCPAQSGDHIVSGALFATQQPFQYLWSDGHRCGFVDATSVDAVAAAVTEKTRVVFVETIANPRTQVAVGAIGEFVHNMAWFMSLITPWSSPYLFQAKAVGARVGGERLTKYIGGHGNALGGAVTEVGDTIGQPSPIFTPNIRAVRPPSGGLQIKKKGLRDLGGSLGPEAAHHIAMGSETLACECSSKG